MLGRLSKEQAANGSVLLLGTQARARPIFRGEMFMAYDTEGHELQRLFANWGKLSERAKSAILILAEVRPPAGPGPFRKIVKPRKGESPGWLIIALNILRDSSGQLSDREIAERLAVSHSTLSRSPEYQRAKQAYFQEVRRVVRRGPRRKRVR